MTRSELLEQIILSDGLVPSGRPNRPGGVLIPQKITIHNTSNPAAGANAKAHANFIRNTGYYNKPDGSKNWVSWHFTVDDKQTIRHIPVNEKAYHAGSTANNISIAIEVCMHAGIDQVKANDRAAQLAALLCYDHALDLDAVVTHQHWTGKNCPVLLLKQWPEFKNKIAYYLAQIRTDVQTASILKDSAERNLFEEEIILCWQSELDSEDFPSVQNGFNQKFLSNERIDLPILPKDHPQSNVHDFIHHQNLSIYFNKQRKLALYTACNFDKSRFYPINRSNVFKDDSTIPSVNQVSDGFYKSKTNDKNRSQNYFDRGHLIARRYNQWGMAEEEAKRGERDTYFYTTIHPQVGELNQGHWEDLESFIIDSGKLDVNRVSILAGAVLSSSDPVAVYEDAFTYESQSLLIPEVYWKVVYYIINGELRKIAFLMSQKEILIRLPMISLSPQKKDLMLEDPFEKLQEPLKAYIVNSKVIENATGLQFISATELYKALDPLEVVDNQKAAMRDIIGGSAEFTFSRYI